MTFPRTQRLAQALQKPLVVFDIEHSGGSKETRGITEFAAHYLLPTGEHKKFSSLVNPGPGVVFNPYAMELTGITPRMVAKAHPWHKVAQVAVLPFTEAVWVGFNSRSCDVPIVRAECERFGLQFPQTPLQMDVRRLSPLKGGLSAQVEALLPHLDTAHAHRAAKDALMTLHLLEHLLGGLSNEQLSQELFPNTKRSRRPRVSAGDAAQKTPEPTQGSGVVQTLQRMAARTATRMGLPWTPAPAPSR